MAGSPEGRPAPRRGFPIGARSPCWPEESKETGGFVAHDFHGKSSVLYLCSAVGGKGGSHATGLAPFPPTGQTGGAGPQARGTVESVWPREEAERGTRFASGGAKVYQAPVPPHRRYPYHHGSSSCRLSSARFSVAIALVSLRWKCSAVSFLVRFASPSGNPKR